MWYPFSFAENGVSKGVHVDIVNLALTNLGYTPTFDPLPWKRCLFTTKNGEYDGLIGASYKPERAEFLYYPPDASKNRSDYRITQVEYSIISHIDSPYDYDGNVHGIPQPIRATLGYSVADNLNNENVVVTETPGDINSFQMLLRDRKGCIITLPEIAHMLMEQPNYRGKFYISKRPFTLKSYFLVFSKQSQVSKGRQQQIWDEIRKIREDDAVMQEIRNKY